MAHADDLHRPLDGVSKGSRGGGPHLCGFHGWAGENNGDSYCLARRLLDQSTGLGDLIMYYHNQGADAEGRPPVMPRAPTASPGHAKAMQ